MHKLNLPNKVQAQYCICIYTCAVAVVLPTWPVKAPLTTLIFKLKALSYQTTNLLSNQAIQPFESAMKTDHPIYIPKILQFSYPSSDDLSWLTAVPLD